MNGNVGYNLVIRKNRFAGSGLSGDSATYGIDLINAGIAGSIAENSFMNNKKGSIHYVAGTTINIENNYVGGSETLVVGNYRNYGTTYSHVFQFSQANRKDADITANYDNLYSVYPYLDSNGEYRIHFIEYTGNQYQIRDLDSM